MSKKQNIKNGVGLFFNMILNKLGIILQFISILVILLMLFIEVDKVASVNISIVCFVIILFVSLFGLTGAYKPLCEHSSEKLQKDVEELRITFKAFAIVATFVIAVLGLLTYKEMGKMVNDRVDTLVMKSFSDSINVARASVKSLSNRCSSLSLKYDSLIDVIDSIRITTPCTLYVPRSIQNSDLLYENSELTGTIRLEEKSNPKTNVTVNNFRVEDIKKRRKDSVDMFVLFGSKN